MKINFKFVPRPIGLPGDDAGCRREIVARNATCKVERCSCGMLHVTIGPLTLRFDPGALEEVHRALFDALARLSARDEVERLRGAPSA